MKKKSLSVFDVKRFVLNDGIHTIAYLHKDFQKIDSHRWSQIKTIQKDSHKWLQIKINAYK